MAQCRICGAEYYRQTYTDPEEPCWCGEGVTCDSPWQYAGFNGIWNQFRYWLTRIVEKRITVPFFKWGYAPYQHRAPKP